jgi:hypothetical protein
MEGVNRSHLLYPRQKPTLRRHVHKGLAVVEDPGALYGVHQLPAAEQRPLHPNVVRKHVLA